MLAGFPFPHRQLSHGTETPSAVWKVQLDPFQDEALVNHRSHSSVLCQVQAFGILFEYVSRQASGECLYKVIDEL